MVIGRQATGRDGNDRRGADARRLDIHASSPLPPSSERPAFPLPLFLHSFHANSPPPSQPRPNRRKNCFPCLSSLLPSFPRLNLSSLIAVFGRRRGIQCQPAFHPSSSFLLSSFLPCLPATKARKISATLARYFLPSLLTMQQMVGSCRPGLLMSFPRWHQSRWHRGSSEAVVVCVQWLQSWRKKNLIRSVHSIVLSRISWRVSLSR